MALGLTQPPTEMRTRYISWRVKCVGLTTLPPSCANCLEIWEPQPPGTLRSCPGLSWDCFCYVCVNSVHFYWLLFIIFTNKNIYLWYSIILQMLLNVSVPLHHLQRAYILLYILPMVQISPHNDLLFCIIVIFYDFSKCNTWAPWKWCRSTKTRRSICNVISVILYYIYTVEPRFIVFQGVGENKRWMREND